MCYCNNYFDRQVSFKMKLKRNRHLSFVLLYYCGFIFIVIQGVPEYLTNTITFVLFIILTQIWKFKIVFYSLTLCDTRFLNIFTPLLHDQLNLHTTPLIYNKIVFKCFAFNICIDVHIIIKGAHRKILKGGDNILIYQSIHK
jgi:hypothetical protein